MDAMTIRALSILACVLLAGPGSAEAQQQLFACSKICWDPAASGATCSKILATQIELTSYIWAVQHGIIAKGKGLTFSLDLNTPWPSCASETAARHSFSVSGYVGVQSVTSYTVGGLKVGDTIEIHGTGVAKDQRNLLFFTDPSAR